MVHCLHCIFRGVLNTRILNVVNTIKVVIIKDLLITVSFTYKIDLSITATILCITEGCTKRNQPKSYYIFINCIVLYSIHCLTALGHFYAMKMTNIRKKKIRTPKIFTMSHRLEVTDWKYLKISISS